MLEKMAREKRMVQWIIAKLGTQNDILLPVNKTVQKTERCSRPVILNSHNLPVSHENP